MVKPQSQHSGGRGVEQAGCSYAGDGEASWTAPGVSSSPAGQQKDPSDSEDDKKKNKKKQKKDSSSSSSDSDKDKKKKDKKKDKKKGEKEGGQQEDEENVAVSVAGDEVAGPSGYGDEDKKENKPKGDRPVASDLYAEGVQAQPRDQDPGNMSSGTGFVCS
ncbi:unnamed protein product [Boreogadus saida]